MAEENPVEKAITDKTILLTGVGGFIDSGLDEAILKLKSGHLILLDHSERNLGEIDLKLPATPARDLYTSVLGDIRDTKSFDRPRANDSPAFADAPYEAPFRT